MVKRKKKTESKRKGKNNPKISRNTPEKVIEKMKQISSKNFPSIKITSRKKIAMDFAEKVYQKFDVMVKSIVLFGSETKNEVTAGSDIDIIIIVDDSSIKFDEELIFWYREELGKIIQSNPYKQDLHINTIKLTTWWNDLFRGDPVAINILRYGETLIDFGGFFKPIKMLLQEGRIKATPESVYVIINRIPGHLVRSRQAEMSAIEGCYWAFVESAQALLMSIKVLPPSPEHIPELLKEHFVNKKLLSMKHVMNYNDVFDLHKKIIHGEIKDLDGKIIDDFQEKAEAFFKVALKMIDEII